MKPIRVILWDIDGTLLNFLAAEKEAIRTCFRLFDMGECTDEMIGRYSGINRRYWEALERGELSKPEVLTGRFREFFGLENLDVSKAEAFNAEYQIRLGDTCVFCDKADELMTLLKGKVYQYAVTNGTLEAQTRKLSHSGLGKLLDDVFISDCIGFEKPTAAFFEPVFKTVAGLDPETPVEKEQILIVGDSLTSDIRGGNNVGIKTCWYNPAGFINNRQVHVDYEIRSLWDVLDIPGLEIQKEGSME